MYYGEPTVIPQGQQMPLSIKQAGDLPQGLVESRSREILCYTFTIDVKFGRHIGSAADISACQIWERYVNYYIQSRGFETLRYFMVRRLTA